MWWVTNFNSQPVDVIAIDHLPTLVPREASDKFVEDLLPTLLELQNREESVVWKEAEKIYWDKVATL